uniref:Uncharacterized protein n=1 Tax=Oryza glumipatula TaxID=40148 RepID=A0A0E0BPJ0_9ORYZ
MSLCFTHLKANGQYAERLAEVQSIGAIYGQELVGIPQCRWQRRPVLSVEAPVLRSKSRGDSVFVVGGERSTGGEAGGGRQKREAEAAMAAATLVNSGEDGGLVRFNEARGVPGWRRPKLGRPGAAARGAAGSGRTEQWRREATPATDWMG